MTISLSQIVSVALVLAVVYYVMSMLISSLTKWALEFFEQRGRVLEDFLKNHLEKGAGDAKNFTVERLKQLPQINSLRPVRYAWGGLGRLFGKTRLSDHVEKIQPKALVDALFDLEGTATDWQNKVINVIDKLPGEIPSLSGHPAKFEEKEKLKELVKEKFYSFDQWREKLETYFGSVMDQAAQKFAAIAKTYALWISLIVAFILGVDSIQIAGQAWFDPQLTKKADAYAEAILQSDESGEDTQAEIKALYGKLEDLAVIHLAWYVMEEVEDGSGGTKSVVKSYPWYIRPEPVKEEGKYPELVSPYTKWSNSLPDNAWLWYKILGIIITGVAVSQGSSFWYDIIRQIKGEAKKSEPAAGEATGTSPGAGTETYEKAAVSTPKEKPGQ